MERPTTQNRSLANDRHDKPPELAGEELVHVALAAGEEGLITNIGHSFEHLGNGRYRPEFIRPPAGIIGPLPALGLITIVARLSQLPRPL